MELYLDQLYYEFEGICDETGADCSGFVDFFDIDNFIPVG